MLIEIESGVLTIENKVLVSIPEWTIQRGKLYALCGVTGSGKSTIGKWLANMEPVYWEASGNITKPESHSYRRNNRSDAGPLYLLQDAYKIFNPYIPILTHFKDIWKSHSKVSSIAEFDDIFEILSAIGIENPDILIRRKVDQISQGEAQRFAFVLGLIRSASLRIYDEVFSNVDMDASKKMLSFLRDFCARTETSAIVISHETSLIEDYIKNIYKIEDGELRRMDSQSMTSLPGKTHSAFKPLLEMDALKVTGYSTRRKDVNILSGLPSFMIGRGEVVGLHGVSGVGKTTFLKGLLGEHPLIWERCLVSSTQKPPCTDLTTLDIRYLPQSVLSAFNPAYPLGVSIKEIQKVWHVGIEEVEVLLKRFDLDIEYLDKFPDEVSGGEIQRMGIIATMLGNPDLVLLDESFSSLDQETRENIWGVLLEEQSLKSFSIMVVSHDVPWLRANANRVYELRAYS